MNTKRICRIFATCLALGVVSSVYAECTSVLAVIRHGEDDNNGLNSAGWAHGAAYGHLLKVGGGDSFPRLDTLLQGEISNICPFSKIVSYYTTKPRNTAEKIRDNLGGEIEGVELKGSDKWPHLDKAPKLEEGASTLVVLNRQAMWGKGGNPDGGTFLDLVVANDNRDKIIKAGSPMFNFLYIFKDQTTDGFRSFKNVFIYVQKYDYWDAKANSYKTNQCNLRLHNGSEKWPLTISALTPMPYNGLVNSGWDCTWD